MAVRLRIYPSYGAGMAGGMYGAGGYGVSALLNERLNNTKSTAKLHLDYMKALYNERLKNVELQSRIKYGGYGLGGYGIPGVGLPGTMLPGSVLGAGMVGNMMGGMLPGLIGGHGQVNITNQSAAGSAHQTVSNKNVRHSEVLPHPAMPWGAPTWGMPSWGGYPSTGGGLLSRIFGGW